MGEADSALREEVEKVRERARLQAQAQGLGPDAAANAGNAAVEEFCSRWGIRPEMVAPGVLRGGDFSANRGPPPREEGRHLDLGASPIRPANNPGHTQAIRISDLLKRAKEAEPFSGHEPAPAPAAAPGSGSNLSSLLQRLRIAEPARPAPVPDQAPAPAKVHRTPARGVVQGVVTPTALPGGGAAPPGGGAAPPVEDERRRKVIEEFDRTYAEVQAMLEQRIGVVDIALDGASAGISGVLARARAGGLDPVQMEALTSNVDRLRRQLAVMVGLCDEFLGEKGRIDPAPPKDAK